MRTGKKKQPTYRVVAADGRSPRDGRFIEIVGTYAPRGLSTRQPRSHHRDRHRQSPQVAAPRRPADRARREAPASHRSVGRVQAGALEVTDSDMGTDSGMDTDMDTDNEMDMAGNEASDGFDDMAGNRGRRRDGSCRPRLHHPVHCHRSRIGRARSRREWPHRPFPHSCGGGGHGTHDRAPRTGRPGDHGPSCGWPDRATEWIPTSTSSTTDDQGARPGICPARTGHFSKWAASWVPTGCGARSSSNW